MDNATDNRKYAREDVTLNDLFERALPALRVVVAFDHARLVVPDARASCSPRLWTTDGESATLDATSLDDRFSIERELRATGARSVLGVPLRHGKNEHGLLVLTTSSQWNANDATRVAPVVDWLASAAEHEQALHQRQRRRAAMENMLPTLASALDVREVFASLSSALQEAIPHDTLIFALLSEDRGGVKVQAATQAGMLELPEYRFSTADEKLDANWKFLLAYDLTPLGQGKVRARITPRDAQTETLIEVSPGAQWVNFLETSGFRSVVRAPIRLGGQPGGGIAFVAARPDAFDEEDGLLAARIADHIALGLAHQHLADQSRQKALAEERATQLSLRVETLSRELDRFSAHRAIGQSRAWKKVLEQATQVASADTTVLITGESGTGKEVVARFLHRGSTRVKGPFIAVNCAALPEQLLESELFGHERGAFTGALQSYAGRLEQAAGGTLFLDEVGEMSPTVQARFLRVLQEREFQRLGSSKTIKADVRLIAATNRDPKRAMESGALREDLYYRLSVFELHLPPLRDRPDDIVVLAEAFLDEIGRSVGRPAAGLSEDAREHLLAHRWPGNVRELRNAVERAVILCRGGLVTREHLPMALAATAEPASATPRLPDAELELVQKAMREAGENKSRAARILGLSRGQLYSLLRRHGLTDAKR